jgi:hypothetical protein
MRAQPIPPAWIKLVTSILESHDPENIEWSFTAEQDWHPFGLEQDAYALLIKTLNRPQVLGHPVVGMLDRRDGSYTDCWAFFCDHPWGSPVPLYAKIGIHHSRVHINLFSLHPDDGSEKLQQAIAAYLKHHKT